MGSPGSRARPCSQRLSASSGLPELKAAVARRTISSAVCCLMPGRLEHSARPARTVLTSPRLRLFDSHIFQPQWGAILDALEVVETFAHYSWAWFSVVSGPATETTNHPARKGQ